MVEEKTGFFAFVLMPFNEDFDDVYHFGIKKCAEEIGIIAERVDEQHFTETILERIYRQIDSCDIVIADMTGQNPNVFYEVGYAHAKGKLCALITQESSHIPFDLKHHTHVIYDGRAVDLVDKLRPKLNWLVEEVKKARKEIFSLAINCGSGYLNCSESTHKGNFDLELTLRNNSGKRSPEIEVIHIITNSHWTLSEDGKEIKYDEYTDDNRKMRKHLVNPSLRRLPSGGFSKTKVNFRRNFWTKWNGQEKKEVYKAKGNIHFEIAAGDGIYKFDQFVEVEFDEIPF